MNQPNFFTAVRRKSATVQVGGQPLTISTPGLLRFAEFHHTWQLYQDALGSTDRLDKLRAFSACISSVIGDAYTRILPGELDTVMSTIAELYQYPPPFLWQQAIPEQPEIKKKNEATLTANIDYPGRYVLSFVAILSRVFHWEPQTILDMTFYEASAYVQEAMIADHELRDWDYTLADVGYKKVGEEWVKQPLPPLPWMRQQFVEPEKKMMPKSMQPAGVIYDLSTYAKEGSARRYDIPLKASAGTQDGEDGSAHSAGDVGTSDEAR